MQIFLWFIPALILVGICIWNFVEENMSGAVGWTLVTILYSAIYFLTYPQVITK